MRPVLRLIIAVAVSLACARHTSAITSANHKGANPGRSGVCDAAPVTDFGELKWTLKAEGSVLSPVIANGSVYFCVVGHGLRAVDLQTGKETLCLHPDKGVSSGFAIADDVIYYAIGTRLAAADTKGRELWHVEVTGQTVTSIVVTEGVVYARTYDGLIHAVEATTGRLKWRHEPTEPRAWRAHPAVGGGFLVTSDESGRLYALDTDTGRLAWETQLEKPAREWSAIVGSTVYVTSYGSHLLALDLKTGKEKWRVRTELPLRTPPAVANELILVGTSSNGLCAFDARTGALKWQGAEGQNVMGPPVIAGHMAYFLEGYHGLCAVHIKTGAEKWRFRVDTTCLTTPTVGDGVVCFIAGIDEPTSLYVVSTSSVPPEMTPPPAE